MIEQLFLALMLLLPPAARFSSCIQQHRSFIVEKVALAEEEHGIPPAVMLVVAYLESHYGCHPNSGGCWGAPIDMQHRLTAGTPNHAAVALHTGFYGEGRVDRNGNPTGFRGCHTWLGAVSRFRCGLCSCPAYRRAPIPANGDCTSLGRYWKRTRAGNRCIRDLGYTAEYAITRVELMHERTGVALPANLRTVAEP